MLSNGRKEMYLKSALACINQAIEENDMQWLGNAQVLITLVMREYEIEDV